MKKSRFSEHQIITILKEVEAGRTAKDVCREYGISNATYIYLEERIRGHGSVRHQAHARA